MKLLLDAHTLIWALDDPTRLGNRAGLELIGERRSDI